MTAAEHEEELHRGGGGGASPSFRDAEYGSMALATEVGRHYSIPIQGSIQDEDCGLLFRHDRHDRQQQDSPAPSTASSTEAESEGFLSERPTIVAAARRGCCCGGSGGSIRPLDDAWFRCLGFAENPLQSTTATGERNSAAADLRLSMLSNFSTAYNILNISFALPIMKGLYPTTATAASGAANVDDGSLCSSALIAGMIVGQVAGGALGDALGRHRAMTVVMACQVLASLLSACVVDDFSFFHTSGGMGGSNNNSHAVSIYHVLAATRFVLGLGAGGVYPLAATLTAESSKASGGTRAKSVALAFSSQGMGYLAVPVIAYLIVAGTMGTNSNNNNNNNVETTTTTTGRWTADFAWRLLLALGALPGIVLTVLRTRRRLPEKQRRLTLAERLPSVTGPEKPGVQPRVVPVSITDAIGMERNLWRKMMGTGGCWLLFDILFYGNTLFQPVVLSAAFGKSETVQKAARDSAILALMALPGYFVSVYAVGKQSPRFIQIQGFFVMGMLYLCIGVLFETLAGHKIVLLVVYGATFFFSNYGPNATTYMLPSMTFSRACRSTLNGVCAACGKAGALIGTMVFVAAADRYGHQAVFLACALLSFVGCIITLACVPGKVGTVDPDEDEYQSMTGQERFEAEARLSSVPIKLVYSQPSLVDFLEE